MTICDLSDGFQTEIGDEVRRSCPNEEKASESVAAREYALSVSLSSSTRGESKGSIYLPSPPPVVIYRWVQRPGAWRSKQATSQSEQRSAAIAPWS